MTAETSAVSIALTRQMLWRFAGAPAPFELLDIDKPMSIERGGHADVREGVAGLSRKAAAVISGKGVAGHAEPVSLVAGKGLESTEAAGIADTANANARKSKANPCATSSPTPSNPQTRGDLQGRHRRRAIAQGGRSRRRGAGGRRRLRRCRDRDHVCARRAGALDERARRRRRDGALSRPRGPL